MACRNRIRKSTRLIAVHHALLRDEENSVVTCLACSPNGRYVAVGSSGNMLEVWDEHFRPVPMFGWRSNGVTCLDWSPDSKYIASGGNDNSIKLDAIERHAMNLGTYVKYDRTMCVAWSPDGKKVAAGGCNGNLLIWIPFRNSRTDIQAGHMSSVASMRWSEDSLRLVSQGSDGVVITYDATGIVLHQAWLEPPIPRSVNQHITVAITARTPIEDTLVVSDSLTGKVTHRFTTDPVSCMALMPNGKHVLLARDDWVAVVFVCPWSDRKHHLFPSAFKAQVFLLMCVRQRLRAEGRHKEWLDMCLWLSIFDALDSIGNVRIRF
jgi:WD40 repeat protein